MTNSREHVPLDIAEVFQRVHGHMMAAGAYQKDNRILLSRDLSASQSEHLFSISKPVPEEEAITLSGDYVNKVFDGPYEKKCAEAYGHNYIVGVARV